MKNYQQPSPEKQQVNEPDMSRSYTAREYLEWTFDGLYEIIRGKVFKMSPSPGTIHQRISMNLTRIFLPHFHKKSNCEIFVAPLDVFFVKPGKNWKDTNIILEPDLCLVCDATKIHKRGIIGSPDFVLEILSPSTSAKDQKLKFDIYEEYQVPEYWIVDPAKRSISRNVLKNGSYEIQPAAVMGDEIYPAQFPQVKVALNDVFHAPGKSED